MILATLCYVKKNKKTLMIHRIKKQQDMHEGKWNGLGGKMEKGESPEECVVREVYEESGLKIKNPKLKGILTFPEFDSKNDWYVFLFVVRQFSGKLVDSSEGNLEWIEDSKLLDLNLWEGDKTFLPLLSRPGFFSGKFMYKNGKLISHKVIFYRGNQ